MSEGFLRRHCQLKIPSFRLVQEVFSHLLSAFIEQTLQSYSIYRPIHWVDVWCAAGSDNTCGSCFPECNATPRSGDDVLLMA